MTFRSVESFQMLGQSAILGHYRFKSSMIAPTAPIQPPINVSRQDRSRAEQIALVYSLLPSGIIATLSVAAILALGLAGRVSNAWLYIWLASVLVVSGVRMFNLRALRRSTAPADPRWIQQFYFGATAAGLTWGLAGFMLFPTDSGGQLLMTSAIAGIAAGGMSTLGILPGAYMIFLLTGVLPFSIRLFMQQSDIYNLMGLMSLVFVTFLLTASRRAHTAYVESQRLRFENEDMAEKLNALATTAITDSLTGAYNRNMLNAALPSEMERARRYNLPLAVILLDIDHFKRINDSHGHQVGDRTLVWITERIFSQLRDADLLFRWGGEEFMVLAPNTDQAAACSVADRMRREIEQSPIEPAGIITCSFGCSQFLPDDTRDSFIQRADRALYVAKSNGRNCVEMI